jgi:hypothetical protein
MHCEEANYVEGLEPGAVIIDSWCPVPKKQRLFRRAGKSHFGYLK